MAEAADIHTLYEESVQNVEQETDFLIETFKKLRGRSPVSLREDFCGTANECCEWVSRDEAHVAIGVDFDRDVQDWGRRHHLAKLSAEAQSRVKLVTADVLEAETPPVDITVAMNFSYWTFKTRDQLRAYFQRVHDHLGADGIFVLDAFGGSEAHEESKEKTKHDGFTYIWHQKKVDPVTGRMICHIHFKFPDGSRIKKAFSYEWRFWSLPELQEILREAGFSDVTVYWEGWDEDEEEGNGVFEPVEEGEADPAWIVYIVAQK
ncbi:MAG: class I SAM-dependent methyltransferase [Gammaproteobacteria bacterium]|nr:class I SAM-dependent methyltransferase [Gammaproteobacteria bacterium]